MNIDYAIAIPPIKYCILYHSMMYCFRVLDLFLFDYKIVSKVSFKWSIKHSDIILTVSNIQNKLNHLLEQIVIITNAVNPFFFFEEYDKKSNCWKLRDNFGIEIIFCYKPFKNQEKFWLSNERFLLKMINIKTFLVL
jgi:hypothetical protein